MHLENLRIYVDSFLESQCIDLFFPALRKTLEDPKLSSI